MEVAPSEESHQDTPGALRTRSLREQHQAQGRLACPWSVSTFFVSFSPVDILTEKRAEIADPLHALINVSERGLTEHLPVALADLIAHGAKHLRRCYPRGTRVQSTNMDPLPAWRCGTQIVALNMQGWDTSVQFNSALFEGTQGWVLKPESLRGGRPASGEKVLKLQVIGADDGAFCLDDMVADVD